MTDSFVTLDDPITRDIGPFSDRSAQTGPALALPPGTTVVSADSHWEISDDIFYENFPARLRDKAPRVWFDRYWHIGYRGEVEAFPLGEKGIQGLIRSIGTGVADMPQRYRDMDAECVDRELCFPQTLVAFVRYPDLEVQEALYWTYNEYMAARQAASGGRSFGVGVFSNWWDPAAAERSMRQIVDLGLKTFMVPVNPSAGANTKSLSYGDPEFDRFWAVVEEAGLPMNFHVGEGIDLEHRGGVGSSTMVTMAPFRKPLAQLIFGGVFDRHPGLKIVFSEGGLSWVPPALQDAEMIYDSFGNGEMVDRLDHRPSHYWHNNCYATFQNDKLGLSQLELIGADRAMWASDYPHSEGTFGYGRATLQTVLDATSPETAKAIIGGTATALYKLDEPA